VIYKEVTDKKGKKKTIDVLKKDCEDKNNARNRDTHSVTRANDMLKGQKEANQNIDVELSNNTENTLISLITIKDKLIKDSE
jgi:hypothetical protein